MSRPDGAAAGDAAAGSVAGAAGSESAGGSDSADGFAADRPSTRERLRRGLYAGHLLTAWALGVSNGLLGLALLLGPLLGPWRRLREPLARRALACAAAYLLLLVGSIAASREPRTSLRSISEVTSFATLGLALVWLEGERKVRALVDALLLVGTGVAISGLFQVLIGYGDIDRRIRGPFSHYMTFAGTLLLLDLMLVARLLLRRPPAGPTRRAGPTAWLDRPAVAWSALALLNLALVVSLTRSAWLALVAALGGIAALVRPKLLLAALPVAAIFLVVAPVPVVERVFSIADLRDESNYDRIGMAEAGARMIAERPLLGVGPDMVKRLYPLYRHPSAPRLLTPHLHNAYVQLAAERGLPALAAYLGLIGCAALAAWRGFRRARAADDGAADLHLGVLAALAGFSVAALFENNWGDTEVQRLVLFLIALPFTLAARAGTPVATGPGAPESTS